MYKDNKYTKIYYAIIENAQKEPREGYTEIHHIIPKCLGGNNDSENLVTLTYREHYICHCLLTKMHDSPLLVKAFWAMSNKNRGKYYNSRLYDMARKSYSDSIIGDNHWAKTEEYRKRLSDEWAKGDRKKRFAEKVSGDNHWTRKTDMSEHAKRMRETRDDEAFSKNHSEFMKRYMREVGFTEEQLDKMRKPKPKVTCPHCEKTGGKPVMMRYHFDNCKSKT